MTNLIPFCTRFELPPPVLAPDYRPVHLIFRRGCLQACCEHPKGPSHLSGSTLTQKEPGRLRENKPHTRTHARTHTHTHTHTHRSSLLHTCPSAKSGSREKRWNERRLSYHFSCSAHQTLG
eukprot:6456116-Amphidinium_carterae.4